MKITFRGRKAFPDGTIRDYGKYGKYQKQGTQWKRMKSGYPTFRKTLNYKKMKVFLLAKGYLEEYFETKGVKTLRSLIKSNYQEEYNEFNNGKSIRKQTTTNNSA